MIGSEARSSTMKRIFRARKEKGVYRTVFLLTEEERAKKRPKNLNGGRPPDNATPEQLTVWRRDMNRRNDFQKRDAQPSDGRLPDATSVNRLWKMIKTSQQRRERIAEGCCPTHGFSMPQIDGWYSTDSGQKYTIVGCPQEDCRIRAKAYSIDGPWELMAADEQPEGTLL
jgi:hypothetical protein